MMNLSADYANIKMMGDFLGNYGDIYTKKRGMQANEDFSVVGE